MLNTQSAASNQSGSVLCRGGWIPGRFGLWWLKENTQLVDISYVNTFGAYANILANCIGVARLLVAHAFYW